MAFLILGLMLVAAVFHQPFVPILLIGALCQMSLAYLITADRLFIYLGLILLVNGGLYWMVRQPGTPLPLPEVMHTVTWFGTVLLSSISFVWATMRSLPIKKT